MKWEGSEKGDEQGKGGMKNDRLQQKSLIKASEASVELKVSVATIYKWYQMGKIDGLNVNGKSLRIFNESLLDFVQSRVDGIERK